MALPLEAPAEYRVTNPEGSTLDQIASDFPQLRNLAEKRPDLLIYTSSCAASYEEVRPFYNVHPVNQPGAIVRPRSDTEVAALIKEAQAKDIPFGLRTGGHDLAAEQLQGPEGIIIDLRGLDSIVIAEDKKSVRAGGGILSLALSKFLREHKLLAAHGWCGGVGLTAWSLGGGYGTSSGFYGFGVDQVLGARIVLANGEVVDTDDGAHADLLWALRGAGNGNFGVVVELRVKVHLMTGYLGGLLAFRQEDASQMLARYAEFEQDIPVNYSGDMVGVTVPGVGPVLAWVFSWTSEDENLDDGWAFHAKMKALGEPVMDTVAEVDDYTFFSSLDFPSSRVHARVRTFESFSPGVIDHLAQSPLVGPAPSVTVIHRASGRALRENPDACYPLRNRHYILSLNAGAADINFDAAAFEKAVKWSDDLAEGLSSKGLALPYNYRNLGPDSDVDFLANFGAEALSQLKEIKLKYDPGNVFRTGMLRLESMG